MPKKRERKISTWSILNKWLYDGSLTTQVPEDVVKDKSISQMVLLYHFQCSPFILILSKIFNNWNLFSLDRTEVFKFLKQCVSNTGYKPPFIQRGPKIKSKFLDILKLKYPYLKKEEVFMIINVIDNLEDKDNYYEMFGLYKPKKKKTTKAQREKMLKEFKKTAESKSEEVSLTSLMENFDAK